MWVDWIPWQTVSPSPLIQEEGMRVEIQQHEVMAEPKSSYRAQKELPRKQSEIQLQHFPTTTKTR